MDTYLRRFDAYCAHLRAEGKARTTVTKRRELLVRVARDLGDPAALTTDQIAGWLARDGWEPATKSNYYHHLNGYLRWLQQRGLLLGANPLELLKATKVPKSKPRPIRLELYRRIVAEAVEPWRTCALLAGLQGLRAGEIARLHTLDIDEDVLVVRKGKGGKTHELGTNPWVWKAVRDLPYGPVILTPRGRPYGPTTLSNGFARYCRRHLGIDTTLHPFRHRYCTDLRRSGYDLRVVQEAARHGSLKTTELYTEVEEPETRAAIRSLRPPAA